MDSKKLIIIGVIILIIAAATILFVVLTSVDYERIEITPNGTSMEVPAKTKYHSDLNPIKIWNWKEGVLVTYNSHEISDILALAGFDFNSITDWVKSGEMQNIDGYECYVLDADELLEIHVFDIIKVNYNGKFYCIPLTNETTHDNIIIFCKDKDIALHMAKSVQYKNVYPNDTILGANSTISNITGDLKSKANDYINNTNWSDVKSAIDDKAGDLESKINDTDVKSAIGELTDGLIVKIPINNL